MSIRPLAILLVVSSLLAAITYVILRPPSPTLNKETITERQAAIASAFQEDAVPPTKEETAEIDALFKSLGEALTQGDVKKIKYRFDAETMFALMEKQGLIPKELLRNRSRVIALIKRLLIAHLADPPKIGWTQHKIRRVHFLKPRTEAVVYATLRPASQPPNSNQDATDNASVSSNLETYP